MYYRGPHDVLLCFSLNDLLSFDHTHHWLDGILKRVTDDAFIALVGTKSDLVNSIDENRIHAFAQSNQLEFFNCSAKQNVGVEKLFHSVVKTIIERKSWSGHQTPR